MLFTKKFKRVTSMLTIVMVLFAMVITAPTASACSALELTSAEGDVYAAFTERVNNLFTAFEGK